MRKSSSSTVESGWDEAEPSREGESKLGWSKFTRNLFEMASSLENEAAIGFNADGDCLEIRNPRLLGSDILPKYYKHKNVSSFVRQLNNYGFKTTPSGGGNNDTIQSFYHENFKRGRLDLLGLVSRRGASKGEKDTKTMQMEIANLKRREGEQRAKARELEEQNKHLIMENTALVEENKRLKANWGVIRDSMGLQKPPPPMHHQQQQTGQPHAAYHDGSGVPTMYGSYADPHQHAAMYRPVQLPLFTPVTQNMDPSNPGSILQHVILDDDFHRSGGPFGNLDS
jgi:regulator of replication initiation timing